MTTLFTLNFWRDAGERALKSFAQAVILTLGGGATNVLTLDWSTIIGGGLGGGLLSLLTSIASAGIANRGTASLTDAVQPKQ